MRRTVCLTAQERAELQELVRSGKPAYLRERAACILKVAEGQVAAHVAAHGLLQRRAPDTVYSWLNRFQAERIAGLKMKPGRGRKPAFPPGSQTPEQARARILEVLHQSPREYGQERTRWILEALRQACPWWHERTLAGVWVVLRRLGIHWLRGRDHLHSPDPHYRAKLDWVRLLQELVQRLPGQHVLLWQDEMTYYRQPTVSCAWEGEGQPLAERSYRSNTAWRVVAALNPGNGTVHYHQAYHITVPTLVDFYAQLCDHYVGQHIWLVQDNWPVHFHPQVLAALEPQETPFPWHLSGSWAHIPTPQPRPVPLPIQLVLLPTYAPWCNPTEKLWRKLKQDVLHLHRWADDLDELRRQVDRFLAQFAQGSTELLRYVGLLVPN